MAPMAPSDPPAPLDLSDLATWLVAQRWFRSRSRTLREVSVHDAIDLPSGHGAVLVMRASFGDSGQERYLVPIVDTGSGPREPADGDGAWRNLLAQTAGGPRTLSGRLGSLVLEPGAALGELLPGGASEAESLTEQAMGVEQSNTSIRLGDRLLLKIYRLLEPGTNPEVEVLAFLTERGFAHAPRAGGSLHYVPDDAEPAAAGIVESLVPSRGDAWNWMLEHLAGPSAEPRQAIAAASEIGGVTAELHAALQSTPDDPNFPWRAATEGERQTWQGEAEAELAAARAAARDEYRERLSTVADRVGAAFEAM
ncbi:MAG TPA: hypothetical protein VF114_09285, partial [Candidatus Limnocylindria bacterium]